MDLESDDRGNANSGCSQSDYQEMSTLVMMIVLLRPNRETPDLVWWRSAGLERLTLVDVRFCSIHMVWYGMVWYGIPWYVAHIYAYFQEAGQSYLRKNQSVPFSICNCI